MSIRIDIEWPDGAIEARHLTGPGPWTIGGLAADVNLRGIDGVVARAMRDASGRVAVACPPGAPPQPWPPDAPMHVGPAALHLRVEHAEDDVATVALVRPTIDELASVALPRPDAPIPADAAGAHGRAPISPDALSSDAPSSDGPNPPDAAGAPGRAPGIRSAGPRAADAERAEAAAPAGDRQRVSPAQVGLWGLVVAMGAGILWLLGGGP